MFQFKRHSAMCKHDLARRLRCQLTGFAFGGGPQLSADNIVKSKACFDAKDCHRRRSRE